MHDVCFASIWAGSNAEASKYRHALAGIPVYGTEQQYGGHAMASCQPPVQTVRNAAVGKHGVSSGWLCLAEALARRLIYPINAPPAVLMVRVWFWLKTCSTLGPATYLNTHACQGHVGALPPRHPYTTSLPPCRVCASCENNRNSLSYGKHGNGDR